MIATKRKIETEKDRFGGFASRSFGNDIYASTLIEEPTATYRPVQTQEEEIFEIEKEYKLSSPSEFVPQQKLTQTIMPTVHRRHETNSEAKSKTGIKLNFRGKIMIAVYTTVVALLLGLCIYNAFVIGSMKGVVSAKQATLQTQQSELSNLEIEFNNLADESTIKAKLADMSDKNYRTVTESDKVYVKASEKTEVPTYEGSSNFFDKVCEFFSKLFS